MPLANTRSVLSGMHVKDAMRRQIVSLLGTAPIATGIGRLVKFKADALLVVDADDRPAGIVSKTDMIGAYYAGMPVDTPLEAIMVGPLHTCFIDDALDSALDVMRRNRIHQLFAVGAQADHFDGMLNYADILGLVFQVCRSCRKSRLRSAATNQDGVAHADSTTAEVMTPQVITSQVRDNLFTVIEALTTHRMSAVLVVDEQGGPAGVISKTNLVLAWHRGVDPDTEATAVMSRPVVSCDRRQAIHQALTTMLLADLGRIFVHAGDPQTIVGVVSLSDAANHRSGTCKACVSSRMVV